jgi:phosphoglycolate phosphatase
VRRYDLCIFDLDGTLADTREDIAWAANRMRADLGLAEAPAERIYPFIGRGVRNLVERVLALPVDNNYHMVGIRNYDPEAGLQSFRAHYGAHLLEKTRLYPGVPEMLAELHAAGVHLSVATNKPEGFSREILAGLHVAPLFEHVLGGDSVQNRKPHPEAALRILSDTPAPRERTLFVGDSLVDAETAQAAGVDLGLVAWGYEDPQALAGTRAAARFAAASEIVRWVLPL